MCSTIPLSECDVLATGKDTSGTAFCMPHIVNMLLLSVATADYAAATRTGSNVLDCFVQNT